MSTPGEVSLKPSTDEEWAIHAINIHGVFFERWCQKIIADTPGWSVVSTNYPVEFPPPNGPWRGNESALDIRAQHGEGDLLLTLLIECKKNNPEFVDWIFFPKRGAPSPMRLLFRHIQNPPREAPQGGWEVEGAILFAPMTGIHVLADEARETKGTYVGRKSGDLTRTSNAAITDASRQIALATQAIFVEEISHSTALSQYAASLVPMVMQPKYRTQVFLPAIVTTARLFACEFDPEDINPSTGEIPFAKAKLSQQDYLVYEYPLPRSLQLAPKDLVQSLNSGGPEQFSRMHILVINSEHIAEGLSKLIPFM